MTAARSAAGAALDLLSEFDVGLRADVALARYFAGA